MTRIWDQDGMEIKDFLSYILFLNLFQRQQFEGVVETFWKQSSPKMSRWRLADIFKTNDVKLRWKCVKYRPNKRLYAI